MFLPIQTGMQRSTRRSRKVSHHKIRKLENWQEKRQEEIFTLQSCLFSIWLVHGNTWSLEYEMKPLLVIQGTQARSTVKGFEKWFGELDKRLRVRESFSVCCEDREMKATSLRAKRKSGKCWHDSQPRWEAIFALFNFVRTPLLIRVALDIAIWLH